ncbi:MAG: GAP family protein [Methanoregula sp.]|nr:GAP family protein [Methanoregula sp.]
MTSQYGISGVGIPVVFIGKHALVGDVNITNHLEAYIAEAERCPLSNMTAIGTGEGSSATSSACLTVPLVISSALVDSINPCAFSVLIFLLISIISVKNRRKILLVGGVYIAAVFLFNLLTGLGLFSMIHLSGLSFWLSLTGAIVALGLGLVNVIDAVRKEEGFLLAIPESRKESFSHYIREASLPAAFLLGILVGIFELPCIGGIYLAILGLMSRELTLVQGLPYLFLYNFVFVLPLIIILLVVAFGMDPEKADAWRLQHRRTLRLIVGLTMIALGVFILASGIR